MMLRFRPNYFAVVSRVKGSSAGCVLFVKKVRGMIVQNHFSCESGRLVLCDFTRSDIEWRAIGIYAPNADAERERFFAMIKQHLCVHDRSVVMLKQLLDEFELEDVAECIEAGRGARFTQFQGTSHARLDRICMTGDALSKSNNYSVIRLSFSDHCLVQCSVGLKQKENKLNWDVWKFNAKLLYEDAFKDYVIEEIKIFN